MMKTINMLTAALLLCFSLHAQETRLQEELNGCNANCLFTECMVSCEKGAYPSCSCLLGSFANCECKVKTTQVPDRHLPSLKNADLLNESIGRLKEAGFDDYSRVFDQLRFSLEARDAESYYRNMAKLEDMQKSDSERALQAYKLLMK